MWTSGGAILRDLSRAQGAAGGRMAHGELRALRPWDRPPPPAPPPRCLSDEMEEYVRGLAPSDAACEGAPDLRHIQQMLDMIRTLNIAEEEYANDEALIELNSYAIERSRSTNLCRAELAKPARTPPARALGGPSAALGAVHELPDPNKHKKRRRNIALESILGTLGNNDRKDAINCSSEKCTQLKPEDLLTKCQENINKSTSGSDHKKVDGTSYNKIDSNDKVNHWINQRKSPIQRKSTSKQLLREAIRLDPTSMFKRKEKVEVAKPCTKINGETALRNGKSPRNGSVSYVPSADALLCYQRYLENNKQMQIRREEREEASQLSVLITEAFERAAQAEAPERAAREEAPELAAREEAGELAVREEAGELAEREEAGELAAREEAPELAAQAEAPERVAREEAPELAAREESPELAARKEAGELAAREEAWELAAREEAGELAAREETGELAAREEAGELAAREEAWVLSRGVVAASARLAAPRPCLPQEPCLVCFRLTRLTRRAASPAPERLRGWRRTTRSPQGALQPDVLSSER